MATGQVKVTSDALAHMASKLKQSAEDIMTLKSEMDSALNGFLWEDPVGIRFKTTQYPEGFKPLQEILIPQIHQLVESINQTGQFTDLYSEESDFQPYDSSNDHLPGGKDFQPYDNTNDTNPFKNL